MSERNGRLAEEMAHWRGIDWDPIQANVRAVAAKYGIDADELDMHLEGDHGWEPHDIGYADAIEAAARCHLIHGPACTWHPVDPTAWQRADPGGPHG